MFSIYEIVLSPSDLSATRMRLYGRSYLVILPCCDHEALRLARLASLQVPCWWCTRLKLLESCSVMADWHSPS